MTTVAFPLHNWAGNISFAAPALAAPASFEELKSIVVSASHIRVVGAGHSSSALVPTEETLVLMSQIPTSIIIDAETSRATVWGNMGVADFCKNLNSGGFGLSSMGDSRCQEVLGAVSTGTHGSSLHWGSYSDEATLLGLTLLLADGRLLDLSADRPEDRRYLEAARISLGALGILCGATFSVEPAYNLEVVAKKRTLKDALNPAHWLGNEHYEVAYFPWSDVQGALSCFTVSRNRTPHPPLSRGIARFFEILAENEAADAVLRATSLYPPAVPFVARRFFDVLPGNARDVNRSWLAATKLRRVPVHLLEFAVPIDKARDAAEGFRRLAEVFSRKPGKSRYFTQLPAQMRFVRGDRGNLLSPTQGADSCWFGVGSHPSYPGHEPFFREVEEMLLGLGGRPHWGKLFYRTDLVRASYGDTIAAFNEVRAELDPTGKFSNRLTREVLGEAFS